MKVRDLISRAASRFTGSDSARLDAQLLLADVLGKDRTWLFTRDDCEVPESQLNRFWQYVERRALGEPVAHILARREFWGLELECNASTLIPRPDTEILVAHALQLELSENANVLDLGTGTGAIALALASENPGWQVQAVDSSAEAVALAQRNKALSQIANVEIFQSNWFQALAAGQYFDLIVANPPYIDPENRCLGEGDVRFEPRSALTAGNQGMADIQLIASLARNYLCPDGWLLLEHGFDQQGQTQACFTEAGFAEINTCKDLAGLPRVTCGKSQGKVK